MVVAATALTPVALALLIVGIVRDSWGWIGAALATTALAAVLLVVAVRRRRDEFPPGGTAPGPASGDHADPAAADEAVRQLPFPPMAPPAGPPQTPPRDDAYPPESPPHTDSQPPPGQPGPPHAP